MLKKTEMKKPSLETDLKKIMKEYDIKHKLRGGEYEECPDFKQKFADKILYKATDPKSFLHFKKNSRAALDQSVLHSDEHLKAEQEEFALHRATMRYRLFGKDGLNNEKEFKILVDKGVIKEVEEEVDLNVVIAL